MSELLAYALGLVSGWACAILIIREMIRETREKPGRWPGVEGVIVRAGWRR